MGDRQSVEALQWLAYMVRRRNNVTHAGNGSEVHLAGVPNVKVDGYCKDTNEVFEYPGFFLGMGVFDCPIDTSPLVTQMRHCRTGLRKQKRVCKKSETLVILLFRSWVASLEECYVKILAFEMNFARISM